MRASMPHSDFSSSFGSEKLYGNTSIDPPNGLARCGEFVSVITSCRSASRRWAMYLPEKPKAPVTAIRTLAIRQHEKITHSTLPTDGCSLRTACACGLARVAMNAPGSPRRFSLADSHEAAAVPIQPWVIETHGGVRRVANGFPIAALARPSSSYEKSACAANRTSRDEDGVDLTRRCSDRR